MNDTNAWSVYIYHESKYEATEECKYYTTFIARAIFSCISVDMETSDC